MKTVLFLIAALTMVACARGGIDGRPGQDGHSVVSEVVQSAPTCEADGKTVLFGTDQNDNGVLDSADSNVKMITVCNGVKGETGSQGETGATGAQGNAGTNATPVELIKLCPNVVGSYNGNYPEYAFQIANALYGVYSAGGVSSLAQFYPGLYTTTAPGVDCSFTVGADGVTLTH